MTKKSEVSEKLFIYKKPKKRNNFLEYLAITQKEFPKTLKNFLSLIFGYLYKNGKWDRRNLLWREMIA